MERTVAVKSSKECDLVDRCGVSMREDVIKTFSKPWLLRPTDLVAMGDLRPLEPTETNGGEIDLSAATRDTCDIDVVRVETNHLREILELT